VFLIAKAIHPCPDLAVLPELTHINNITKILKADLKKILHSIFLTQILKGGCERPVNLCAYRRPAANGF
jgi:hypothetical protein